jgi:anti-anti-sigma factor
MSVSRPDNFTVRSGRTGALVLAGELDVATIQELQDKIDEVLVPGQPIVLDMVDLTFIDSSAMHCLVRTFEATGRPVVLQNASRALRRILGHMTQEPEAWVFDEQSQTPMPM